MLKVLIHIGLPKTASTTLQNHVFYGLHEKGVMNFLGRKATKKEQDYYFPIGEEVISLICLSDDEFEEKKKKYKKDIFGCLRDDMLNVLSDEMISFYGYMKNNDIEKIFSRLYYLFGEYDVCFLLFIRNQYDFMYSYYVERYGDMIYDKNNDSIEKYYSNVLAKKKEYDMLNYLRIWQAVSKYFKSDKLKIVLYEDLCKNPSVVYKKIASVLGVETNEVAFLLLNNKENVKKKTINGCYVSENVLLSNYFSYINNYMRRNYVYRFIKLGLYDKNFFFVKNVYSSIRDKILPIVVLRKGVEHKRPRYPDSDSIKSIFSQSNNEMAKNANLSINDMERYGYF